MACKTAGIEWADYFLNWQMGIYWALLPTMLVTMYFAQKYWDKREGLDPDFEALREKFRQEEADHEETGEPFDRSDDPNFWR